MHVKPVTKGVRAIIRNGVLILSLLAMTAAGGCSGWTINGLPAETFKHMKGRDYGVLAAGAASSFVIHWLGHVAYLEANGIQWHQDGLHEKVTDPISETQRQWIGRAGFLAQLVAGMFLFYSPWDLGHFETGFHLSTLLEIATYPSIHKTKGDLHFIGKSSDTEWVTYALASSMLVNKRRLEQIAIPFRGGPPAALKGVPLLGVGVLKGINLTPREIEQVTSVALLNERSMMKLFRSSQRS
jgi:hypothetical protein